jgi:hypothetical protein
MAGARYYVVGDREVWVVKVEDGECGPYTGRDAAVIFAIDAALKLGARGSARMCA